MAVELDRLFTSIGFRDDGTVKKTVGQLDRIRTLAGQIGVAFGVGILARGISAFTERVRATGDELDKTSLSLGTSVERLQSLRFAADRSGIGVSQLDGALQGIQKQARDAALGSQTAVVAFSRLGVSVRDSSGELKGAGRLFRESIAGLSRLRSVTERSAVAQQLFGGAGARIAVLANEGAEGLKALEAEARNLGGGFSQRATKAAAGLTDAMTNLNLATTTLLGTIAETFLPLVDSWVRGITDTTVALGRLLQGTEAVRAALVLLGAIAAGVAIKFGLAFAGPLLSLVAVGVALTAIFLAVEDVITTLSGGQSAIGEILLELSKFDAVRFIFEGITDALASTDQALSDLADRFSSPTVRAIVDTVRSFFAGNALSLATGQITADQAAPLNPATNITGGNQNNNVTIEVSGAGDPTAVAEETFRVFDDLLARENAKVFNELVPAVP